LSLDKKLKSELFLTLPQQLLTMAYSRSAALYTISTPDVDWDECDVSAVESHYITSGIKLFTDNFRHNKKIYSIIVDTVDYNDRIKWYNY
jgi:hypothetical protein